MDKKIILTIIVPVYNGENYLINCLDNLSLLDTENIEIIIVDDGSTDNTQSILNNINQQNIKIITKSNGGVGSARNSAIYCSKGDFLFFYDVDDDIIIHEFLESLKILNNDRDIVISNYRMKRNEVIEDCLISKNLGEMISKKILYEKLIGFSDEDFINDYHNITGAPWRYFLPRKVIVDNKIKFNESLKYGEDLLFILQVISKCNNVIFNNKIIYVYNRTFESFTGSKIKEYDKYFLALVKSLYTNLELIEYFNKDLFSVYVMKNLCKSYSIICDHSFNNSIFNQLKRIKYINSTKCISNIISNKTWKSYNNISKVQFFLFKIISTKNTFLQFFVFRCRDVVIKLLNKENDYNM